MAGPITPEKLGAHPALQQFVEYIERHTGEPVDLSRIDVTVERELKPEDNNVRNDGIVELNYFASPNPAKGVLIPYFYGKIHGPAQTLYLRHGLTSDTQDQSQDPETQWAGNLENLPLPIQGACAAVRDLGGERESKASCSDTPEAARLVGASAKLFLSVDFVATLFKTKISREVGKFPFTRLAVRNLTPTGEQMFSTGSRLKGTVLPVFAGAIGYYDSQFLLDHVMGWNPQWHRHERSAAGNLGGYAAYRGVGTFLTPTNVSSSLGAETTARLAPMSFGSGLLSAALVDALIGNNFAEGSPARDAIRTGGFFLPAVYRGIVGSRTLPLIANRPYLGRGGRIAAWAATAGFVADVGMMGYRHLTESEAEITRDNRLYQRAGEIAQVRGNWFSNLWRGALGFIMPSFMERQVPEEYVKDARTELSDSANGLAQGAAQVLRHQLLFGNGGEEKATQFYQQVDWSALRNENKLGVIKKGEGKPDWYLATVASDLANPKLRYDYFENKSVAAQVSFIQGRYRWDLSEDDVQEILGRIALFNAREDLAQIHSYVSPEESPWAAMFDEKGGLKVGAETNLLIHLFAGTGEFPTEEQILALRKVALLVHVRQLRQSFQEKEAASEESWVDHDVRRTHEELKSYESLAKQLGLMNQNGEFIPGEIRDQAMRISVAPAATNQSMPPGGNVIRKVMRENASGLL